MLVFVALTVVSGRITLKVPSTSAYFSPSEMFAFTCVLLFGPEAGAITLAFDSLVLGWQRRLRPAQMLFNFGNLALSVWIAGTGCSFSRRAWRRSSPTRRPTAACCSRSPFSRPVTSSSTAA